MLHILKDLRHNSTKRSVCILLDPYINKSTLRTFLKQLKLFDNIIKYLIIVIVILTLCILEWRGAAYITPKAISLAYVDYSKLKAIKTQQIEEKLFFLAVWKVVNREPRQRVITRDDFSIWKTCVWQAKLFSSSCDLSSSFWSPRPLPVSS